MVRDNVYMPETQQNLRLTFLVSLVWIVAKLWLDFYFTLHGSLSESFVLVVLKATVLLLFEIAENFCTCGILYCLCGSPLMKTETDVRFDIPIC